MSTDEQTIEALRRAMAAQCAGRHLDPHIADSITVRTTPGPRRNRRRTAEVVSPAACLAAVLVVVSLVTGSDPGRRNSTSPSARASCAHAVVTDALPTWARGGFSPDAVVNPHVTGTKHRIVGVLFSDPLRSPAAPGESNKVLWVAKRHGTGPLLINARLAGTWVSTTRTVVGGPGPSTLDLPRPGCWQLTLTWSGQRDTLALPVSG